MKDHIVGRLNRFLPPDHRCSPFLGGRRGDISIVAFFHMRQVQGDIIITVLAFTFTFHSYNFHFPRIALLFERKNKERVVSVVGVNTTGRSIVIGEELATYDKVIMLEARGEEDWCTDLGNKRQKKSVRKKLAIYRWRCLVKTSVT